MARSKRTKRGRDEEADAADVDDDEWCAHSTRGEEARAFVCVCANRCSPPSVNALGQAYRGGWERPPPLLRMRDT